MKVYETRKEMIGDLIPKHGIYAEVGVFKGEFAQYLISTLEPRLIHLIDLYEGDTCSGDQDGNNVVYTNMTHEYEAIQNLYAFDINVKIWKGNSSVVLSKFPDDSLDMIYIDGDHSYEGCKRDLEVSFKKVKHGGYICGHDYEMNMSKAHVSHKFGVRQAVDEFLIEKHQEISAKGNDGCVSFAIKLNKS
jgi:hypothetical protein